jgi:hypothetical protein
VIRRAKTVKPMYQFWPRLEMTPSFVLSELRRFLFVGLCRLEMQNCVRRAHDIVRPAKACGIQTAAFWPRVEILRPFVLWKLRRILHFVQNRVEMPFDSASQDESLRDSQHE